jgi:hypothetical protein
VAEELAGTSTRGRRHLARSVTTAKYSETCGRLAELALQRQLSFELHVRHAGAVSPCSRFTVRNVRDSGECRGIFPHAAARSLLAACVCVCVCVSCWSFSHRTLCASVWLAPSAGPPPSGYVCFLVDHVLPFSASSCFGLLCLSSSGTPHPSHPS